MVGNEAVMIVTTAIQSRRRDFMNCIEINSTKITNRTIDRKSKARVPPCSIMVKSAERCACPSSGGCMILARRA